MIPTSNTSFGMELAIHHNRLKHAFHGMFKNKAILFKSLRMVNNQNYLKP